MKGQESKRWVLFLIVTLLELYLRHGIGNHRVLSQVWGLLNNQKGPGKDKR